MGPFPAERGRFLRLVVFLQRTTMQQVRAVRYQDSQKLHQYQRTIYLVPQRLFQQACEHIACTAGEPTVPHAPLFKRHLSAGGLVFRTQHTITDR